MSAETWEKTFKVLLVVVPWTVTILIEWSRNQ